MNISTLVPVLAAEEFPPYNVLEWSFLGLLSLMVVVIGIFGFVVIARMLEPRGARALMRRIRGKA